MGEQRRRGAQFGATSVEYAILVGLIAVAIMTAVSALGSSLFTDEVEVLGNVLERETSDAGRVRDPYDRVGETGPTDMQMSGHPDARTSRPPLFG